MSSVLLIQIVSITLSFGCGVFIMWLVGRQAGGNQAETAIHSNVPAVPNTIVMPEEVKNQLLSETKQDYETAIEKSAGQFSHDLVATSDKINAQIKDLSANVIANELEEYRSGLAKLREEALAGMGSVQEAVAKQRQVLEAELDQQIQAEKQRRLDQIDTKLGDAVSAFLVEVLQHNVDLGSQSPYLLAMLEEHKEELKQEVSHDV